MCGIWRFPGNSLQIFANIGKCFCENAKIDFQPALYTAFIPDPQASMTTETVLRNLPVSGNDLKIQRYSITGTFFACLNLIWHLISKAGTHYK